MRTPKVKTGYLGINFSAYPTTYIVGVAVIEQDLSIMGVPQRKTMSATLMRHKNLRVVKIFKHIGHMRSISMPHTRGMHACAVRGNNGRPGNNIVLPVAIGINNVNRVVALTRISFVAGSIRIEGPPARQLTFPPIPGCHCQTGIIPPLKNRRRTLTIHISHRRIKTIYPIAIAISPIAHPATLRPISLSSQLFTGGPVENRNILRAFNNVTRLVGVVDAVVGIGCRSLRNKRTCTVAGSRRRFYHQLSPSVAIKIKNQKLCVMSTRPDVGSQLYAPQVFPLQGIGIQNGLV